METFTLGTALREIKYVKAYKKNNKGNIEMSVSATLKPSKWSHVINLYNDGSYSAIWGRCATSSNNTRCLGGRWNEEAKHKSFTNVCSYAENDVIPRMTKAMLLTYIAHVNDNPDVGNLDNLLIALKECDRAIKNKKPLIIS